MNIAVSSVGMDLNSRVDGRFDRARYFLVIDDESNSVRAIDNVPNLERPGGAGIQAASRLVEAGVGAVLTGHCGSKASQVLKAAGVEVYVGAEGTVAEAVESYRLNRLIRAESADVGSHQF